MYPPLHYRSSQSLKPTTKNENRNEDCFLSINILFPFLQTTIKNENRYKDCFFSINILFPSTKLSLTKPDPKPTLKEFFLSPYLELTPTNVFFFIEIHTLLTMLTNITDNTNINLVATSTTCNIHAVICTTYNTSYLRHLQ